MNDLEEFVENLPKSDIKEYNSIDVSLSEEFKKNALRAEQDLLKSVKQTEKVIALNEKGNIILEKGGGKNSVDISELIPQLKASKIMIHNHPGSSSFSAADISSAYKICNGDNSFKVVSKDYIYEAKFNSSAESLDDILNFNKLLIPYYEEIEQEVQPIFNKYYIDLMNINKITESEASSIAWKGHSHSILEKL